MKSLDELIRLFHDRPDSETNSHFRDWLARLEYRKSMYPDRPNVLDSQRDTQG